MLTTVIKRDGTREDFIPRKLNSWGTWAAKTLGNRVDWADVVLGAMRDVKDEVTTQELQKSLIQRCIQKYSWPYNLMAGRLSVPVWRKEIFADGKVPTIQSVHKALQAVGLMRPLDYSDEEYTLVEELVDHEKDFEYSKFQLDYIRHKYTLRDHSKGDKEYETPQIVYMRLAMALSEDDDKAVRMEHVKGFYEVFSGNMVNVPTPYMVSLGTPRYGLASCCVYKADDSGASIAAHQHITDMMTQSSAGLGSFLQVRSEGNPVRGGAIVHNGKGPYWSATAKISKASKQLARAGALTGYFNCFDPDGSKHASTQNFKTPDDQRNRDMHFAVQYNAFFVDKAVKNEKVFTFNTFTAPDLFQAFYNSDREGFATLYAQYEADESFKKHYISARDFIKNASGTQAYEVGTVYEFFADEANTHTPFIDTIYSSNLCVAPETLLLTDEGEVEIHTKKDQEVNVWNGEEWSAVTVRQTGVNQPLFKVMLSHGKKLECTKYHKWYILGDKNEAVEKRTHELVPGMVLVDPNLPGTQSGMLRVVLDIADEGRTADTYCFTEPKRNMGVFNGILTGNCTEIMLPTKGYESVAELYRTDDEVAGEVALCNIGGIVTSNVSDANGVVIEDLYAKAAYYVLRMIDKGIHLSDYVLPHVGYTAKMRMNAGVGMIGVATAMARAKMKYDTVEGRNYLHTLSETHYWHLVQASIELAKERGIAPWSHKTKWPQGWLPIDTYTKNVDQLVTVGNMRDWESVRAVIVGMGGHRFSVVGTNMPSESSSKSSGVPNAYYPVRGIKIKKSDDTSVIEWVATDSDLLEKDYQIAYSINMLDQIKYNAVIQKWTDQGISMDVYADRTLDATIKVSAIIQETAAKVKYGIKARYYVNSLTSDNEDDYVGYKSLAKQAQGTVAAVVAAPTPVTAPVAALSDDAKREQERLAKAKYFENAAKAAPVLDTKLLSSKLGIDLGMPEPVQEEESLTVDESGYRSGDVCAITGGGCTL